MSVKKQRSAQGAGTEATGLRAIFANAGVLLGGKGANALLSLGYLAAAGRALGAEQFGLLVLIHGYAQAVSDLSKFQSWQVVLHYGHPPREAGEIGQVQRVLRFSTLLDGLSAVLGVLVAWAGIIWFGHWLDWPDSARHAAMFYVTSIIFMVNSTPIGLLRLIDRFDLLALRSGGGGLSRFIGAMSCWWLGLGLEGFLVAWYCATLLSFSAMGWTFWRQLRLQGLLKGWSWFSGPLTREFPGIWKFVWSTNIGLTLSMASSRLPLLIVGSLLGAADAGLYRVAKQFADGISQPAKLIVVALYPQMVRQRDQWRELERMSIRLAAICGGVSTAVLLPVALLGGAVLALVLGEPFREGGTVLTLLAAGAVIGVWGLPLEPLMISTGRASTAAKARFVALMVQLPLLYVLTARWDLAGAGLAAVAGALAVFVVQMVPVWRWLRAQRAASALLEVPSAPPGDDAVPDPAAAGRPR